MPTFADAIAAGWSAADRDDPEPTVQYFARLYERHPDNARASFEYASALDFAGRETEAVHHYEKAFAAGLDDDVRRQALIQYGSTLRNVGRDDEAVTTLRSAHEAYPDDASVALFLALALTSAGQARRAVALLLELALEHIDSPGLRQYQIPLRAYAQELAD